MSTSILHITNGDTTTQYLKKLKLKGDFITWREMLCEGKTITDVGSEDFWKTRFDFLKSSYKVSKKRFIDYTLKEYRTLCKSKKQEEIVLWFESDLFCQINMLAVISWLKRYRKGYTISLITNTTSENPKDSFEISQLSGEEIKSGFKNRVTLNKDDIEYADYMWQLYCSESPLRLETVHKFNPMSPFFHIEKAIKSHLLRFPSIDNGLNFVENSILKAVKENTFDTKEQLVRNMLQNQEDYGFGDIQYYHKIQKMKQLFTSFNPVKLSKKGKNVLLNNMNFYGQIRNDLSYLGGAKKYSYLYLNNTNKLLKITS